MNLTQECLRGFQQSGYAVSLKTGSVFGKNGRELHGCLRKNGYIAVAIFIKGLTGPKGYQVNKHQLVAYRKFGDAMFETGIEVRHLDGNRQNNSPDNIAMGTRSDNMMDMPASARKARNKDKRSPARVLNDADAAEIRSVYSRGLLRGECKNMAIAFGVSSSTISEIGRRKSYNA
jgi:HNH endonuclease